MDCFSSISIQGTRVSLIPITKAHAPELTVAGSDEDIWRWMPTAHWRPGSMSEFIDSAIALRAKRLAVPFTIVDRVSGRIVGSTRFHSIEPVHQRLEIGATWIASDFQRSHVNTETKLLQMWYAFEVLACRRVEWKADAENVKSRAAILRLGAKEEGVFRKHMIYPDGRNRDSIYFSIIDDEWPQVKARLQDRLGYAFEPCYLLAEREQE